LQETPMKKTWTTPELIVLVRVQANEMVLGTCKSQYGLGPAKTATGCMNVTGDRACQGHDKS
jgi:hypothetical protein